MDLFSNNEIRNAFSIACIYPKNTFVYHEDDLCERIGYVISGELALIHYTKDGNARILAKLKTGQIFGDFLINSTNNHYPGDLITLSDCEIVFLDKPGIDKLLICNEDFRRYYLQELSDKALKLNYHNKILIQSTLREKILMYLNQETSRLNSSRVPLTTKEALADYLNVARPSLSREMALMKKAGLLDYDKRYIYYL